MDYKIDDYVSSLKTGKRGTIIDTCSTGTYVIKTPSGLEYLQGSQMIHLREQATAGLCFEGDIYP